MILASFITLDRDALVCDFAEFYHIYDMDRLPVEMQATLASGLRENSRIVMKAAGATVSNLDLMLAAVVDRLSLLVYTKTKDAEKRINAPKSLVTALLKHADEKEATFSNGDDFERARREILGGKDGK